jgi:MinD superfamily P-loop ATPase
MVTLCWAAKGGSGTTVVAAALALSSRCPSLLVDLDGEIPAVLGLPEPDRPGIAEWLASDATPDHLPDLMVDIDPTTWLLPWRSGMRPMAPLTPAARWEELGRWLHNWSRLGDCEVTIDAGTGEPSPALIASADRALLVTRPCYLSLRRAVRSATRPTGIVLVHEPGRALSRRDVEHALGVPVEATVSLDPAVARAVDAGLLATRLPRVITRELRRVAA